MKNISNNNLTVAVLYIVTYIVLSIFVLMPFMPSELNVSFPVFLLFLFVPFVPFLIDSCLIKEKWYHFLGCTLPYAVIMIIMSAILYIAYNSGNESALGMTSIEALIYFTIFHYYALATLLWSSAGTIFKYKKYAENKTEKRFVVYKLIIAGLVIIAAGSVILYSSDFLFKQTLLSILPLCAGIIINLIAVLKPD